MTTHSLALAAALLLPMLATEAMFVPARPDWAATCGNGGEPAGRWGYIGPVTGDEEKDTFALICIEARDPDQPNPVHATLVDRFETYMGFYGSDHPTLLGYIKAYIGYRGSDAEKNTLALRSPIDDV